MRSTKQCIRVRLDIRRGDWSDLVNFFSEDLVVMAGFWRSWWWWGLDDDDDDDDDGGGDDDDDGGDGGDGGGGGGGGGGRAHLPRRFKRQLDAKFLKWQLLWTNRFWNWLFWCLHHHRQWLQLSCLRCGRSWLGHRCRGLRLSLGDVRWDMADLWGSKLLFSSTSHIRLSFTLLAWSKKNTNTNTLRKTIAKEIPAFVDVCLL